jgi:hypothetical protein
MTKRLIYGLAMVWLAAEYMYAGGRPITVEIPFQFHVGDSILPAGSYTASTNIASGAVVGLRSSDGKSSVLVVSNAVHSATGPTHPALIFNRYGDEYFLSQVWTGTDDMGRQLRQSRRESELAAAAKRNTQTVLASR